MNIDLQYIILKHWNHSIPWCYPFYDSMHRGGIMTTESYKTVFGRSEILINFVQLPITQNVLYKTYWKLLSRNPHALEWLEHMCAKYLMNIPIISASTHQLKFADFAIFTASCIWDKGIFSTILKLSIKTS